MLHSARSIAGRLRKDERGASLMEYTILLGLITAGCVGTVLALGTTTSNWFDTFKTSIFGTTKLGDGTVK